MDVEVVNRPVNIFLLNHKNKNGSDYKNDEQQLPICPTSPPSGL
jgi:hypothetical protein